MVKADNAPIIYVYLYSVLKERFKCSVVRTSYVLEQMKLRFPKVPKIILYEALKDMEEHQLIQKLNRKFYCILPNNTKRLSQLSSAPLW